MKKAQLTIEYLMILVIMLLLFNSITLDLVNTSLKDTNFIQTAEMVNTSRMVLSDAVNILSLQGSGARKTVYLRAPPDCNYTALAKSVYLACVIGSPSYEDFDEMDVYVLSQSSPISFSTGSIASGNLGNITVSKS